FADWWLSSPSGNSNAATISEENWVVSSSILSRKLGVRPALKLDLSSVIFDSQSNEFTVNIKVDVTGVTLNKTAVTLTVNSTESLAATVAPDNATDNTITWSSDNESVATVSDGIVTAVEEGTANITVTATNGTDDTSDDKTATCAVTVNATSSGGDSSDSGNSGSSDSGSISGGSTDSGSSSGSSSSSNTSSGTSSSSSSSASTSTPAPATVPYENVAISTGAVNDITGTAAATAESNPFGTKIENNDNLTTLLTLTPEEVAQGVNVWLDIQDMSATVPQADKDLVQSASNDFTVGIYLDINLFKKVGGNAATKITETNGTVNVSILIPESLWKAGRTFEIIRVHDGVPTVISGTYDENTNVFTFETDKFSTYALAYNDSAVAASSLNSTQSSAPRTGDNNHLGVWYLLLAVSLGGLGFLAYSKKRKVNK
ncbi:MAG: Ig domain-containing protein, partial [Pseudobutyrivibrio sp.]|nr:Ig domain-containing protein [Pseudobutyrivibrio sp.]